MNQSPQIGSITWCDLTVEDAAQVKQFYCDVVGWQADPQSMGQYDDFNMLQPDKQEAVAGICHARGENSNIPAHWMIYITVEDVDASARRCQQLGGKIVDGPRDLGTGRVCIIQDPAGAVTALYQPSTP